MYKNIIGIVERIKKLKQWYCRYNLSLSDLDYYESLIQLNNNNNNNVF